MGIVFLPVLFGVSLIGCIAGTYSAPPTDEETLINFYTRVRPWGWWKPVEEKALARYPHIQPNKNFKRDAFNVAIGIIWQCALTIIPMYLVVREQLGLWSLYHFAFSHHTYTKEDLVQTFVQRRSTLQ